AFARFPSQNDALVRQHFNDMDREGARVVMKIPRHGGAGLEPALRAAGREVARELLRVRNGFENLLDRLRYSRGHSELEVHGELLLSRRQLCYRTITCQPKTISTGCSRRSRTRSAGGSATSSGCVRSPHLSYACASPSWIAVP